MGREGEGRLRRDQRLGRAAGAPCALPRNQRLNHAHERQRGGVRPRMMMGDAALPQSPFDRRIGSPEGGPSDRSDARRGAVARVALRKRPHRRPVDDVTADAAPTGVSDVGRPAAQPGGEFLASVLRVEASPARLRPRTPLQSFPGSRNRSTSRNFWTLPVGVRGKGSSWKTTVFGVLKPARCSRQLDRTPSRVSA